MVNSFFHNNPRDFYRACRQFWLATARDMRSNRNVAAGDPSPALCIERAKRFHRLAQT